MPYRSYTDVVQMYYRCTTDVVQMWNRCSTASTDGLVLTL